MANIRTYNGKVPVFTNRVPSKSEKFILSGGSETIIGPFGSTTAVMTFTTTGLLTVFGTGSADILVVGGGGGGVGGSSATNGNHGGGGGDVVYGSYTLTPGNYTVTIGAAGSANGGDGGNSRLVGITPIALGGDGDGTSGNVSYTVAAESTDYLGPATQIRSGGGGGCLGSAVSDGGGSSGLGYDSSITGTSQQYGYGGQGGSRDMTLTSTNTHGGGEGYISGGVAHNATSPNPYGQGGSGGSKTTTLTAASSAGAPGVVIIRYTKVV